MLSGKNRQEESRDLLAHQGQQWKSSQAEPFAECQPLRLLRPVLKELCGESKWRRLRQSSAPSFEGAPDGTRKSVQTELAAPGECPDVEEVLHPSVGDAEYNHCVELLGNNDFWGVAADNWSVERQ
jgi:hypothetical protein